jgi:hypothetical protein
VFVAWEGHQGRATARGARSLLMSPVCRKLLGACAAACNVVRVRKPWLICMCQCSAVKMGSRARDTPPGTRVPRYGAHEVIKFDIYRRKTSDFPSLRRESALCAFRSLGTQAQLILHGACGQFDNGPKLIFFGF